MIDRETFKRKFLLRSISSPITLVPVALGITVLLGMWVVGTGSLLVAFIAIVAIVAGFGIAGTRILTQSESLAREVMEEIEKETEATHQRRLDRLQRKLVEDGDSRTEDLLQDLRVLMDAWRGDRSWTEKSGGTRGSLSIIADVERLQEGCIAALEQSLVHHKRKSLSRSDEQRRRFEEQREQVITSVAASIARLGDMLAKIQELSTGEQDPQKALDNLRNELDATLRAAEEVDKEMSGFIDPEKVNEFERYATHT